MADDITLNGNKRVVLGVGLGTILAMLTSIATFWFGFYPTIATEDYVKEQMSDHAKRQISQEAGLRITTLEREMTGLRTELRGISISVNSVETKIDYLLPRQYQPNGQLKSSHLGRPLTDSEG